MKRICMRDIVFFILLLAVPISAWIFVFKPRSRQIEVARTQIAAKQARLDKLEEVTGRIPDLGAEIERGESALVDWGHKLPDVEAVDEILEQITEIALANQLVVKSIRGQKPIPASMYMELPLRTTINGHFDGFYEFLLDLEALPRITRIKELRIERISGTDLPTGDAYPPGSMKAAFTLSIYYDSESTDREQS